MEETEYLIAKEIFYENICSVVPGTTWLPFHAFYWMNLFIDDAHLSRLLALVKEVKNFFINSYYTFSFIR